MPFFSGFILCEFCKVYVRESRGTLLLLKLRFEAWIRTKLEPREVFRTYVRNLIKIYHDLYGEGKPGKETCAQLQKQFNNMC